MSLDLGTGHPTLANPTFTQLASGDLEPSGQATSSRAAFNLGGRGRWARLCHWPGGGGSLPIGRAGPRPGQGGLGLASLGYKAAAGGPWERAGAHCGARPAPGRCSSRDEAGCPWRRLLRPSARTCCTRTCGC